jgi:CubicO group peptidase (beta-lactamase class C family)
MRVIARWSVLVLLLMAARRADAADAALSKELEASITRAIEDELTETRAPGAAVAIVRDGAVVYLRAFGVRSIEERTPVTPDTLFRLGSTTKMLTALAALDAAAKGRVNLDAPVRTYVKDLHPALGGVTLRQLLTHTSGMREASPSVQSIRRRSSAFRTSRLETSGSNPSRPPRRSAIRAPMCTRTSPGSRCPGTASGSS